MTSDVTSDTTSDTTSTDLDVTADTAPRAHQRRGRLGRLYYGETAIDFYGKRWWGLGASILLVLISIGSLATLRLELGIDFVGGVAWEIPSETLSDDDARAVLAANDINSTTAKIQERTSSSGRVLLVQVSDQPAEVRLAVQTDFAEAAGLARDDVSTSSVSSTWGRSITEKAIRALVVFFVFVAMFIAWRLEWRMAVAALVAVVHDLIVSVGIYSLFGFEVTPASVVAFLTILGYSLYDTIVVFDKVQENEKRLSGVRVPYADVMNVSMNQVLMRSLNTTVSSLLPVISLLVVGAGLLGAVALREFSLALLVGLLAGSYSSIFVASPIVVMLKERELKYTSMRGQHATGADLERLVLGGSPASRQSARQQRAAMIAVAGQSPRGVPATPDAVLTHPPRPRKKKRRV